MRPLDAVEARVLGVLVEKSLTVPDSYPLSLNALVLGCNQKTAREPVSAYDEGEVVAAVDALKSLSLVIESSGSRVARYEHNVGRALGLPSQSVALLATLVLRGPQTTSELRVNAERLHRFADASAVEGFLDELAARPDERGGPLVALLPRAAGARESRWAHRLGGDVAAPPRASAADTGVASLSVASSPLPPSSQPVTPSVSTGGSNAYRFDLPADKRLTLEMPIQVRWGDMDAMSHVNNTIYLRYFEMIRIEWLYSIAGEPDPDGEGFVIVNTFCNFLRQLRYPAELVAKHYVSDVGRSSFMAWITLERRDEPGVLYASGGAKTVWVNYREGRSVPLPDAVRAAVLSG